MIDVERNLVATSSDGTEVRYHVLGASRRSAGTEAPALLLCGNLVGGFDEWSPQIAYLRDRFRFVTWDYRRLAPAARFGIDAHARDLRAVLAAVGATECAMLAWGAGVQVALEAFHSLEGRVRGLVLIAGAAGRALEHVPARGAIVRGLEALARVVAGPLAQPARRRAVLAAAHNLAGWLGAPLADLDPDVTDRLADRLATIDPTSCADTLRALFQHDATSLVPEIDVPTLVIAGDRDPITPIARVQELARNLPHSEVLVVKGGGHFVALEYADLVNLRVEQFLLELGSW
jgi:pimeloyl-ACP methyl ester carboxylesterase